LGIRTPRPLAVVEERWGVVRKRAYFIMAHTPGETIEEALRAVANDSAEVAHLLDQLGQLLQQLAAARISHGDFKATNFLLSSNRIYLLDLDGMRAHTTSSAFGRAFRQDLARLKRNWADLPLVERYLAERMPHFFQ
jgi:tRNA A-37 threonylcarbamoyl transferase component Bud32